MSDCGAKGVEKQSLHRVVVECTKRIWDVKSVVDRVEVTVEEGNGVEKSVEEVLPGVDDEAEG